MGYIYKITNKINGKAYIGQSINEPTKSNGRISEHLNGRGNKSRAIHNAIKKYGKDNFSHEVLHAILLDDQLDELEVQAIKEHNTMAPNGYNLTSGGGTPKDISNETRQKLSDISKNNWQDPKYRTKTIEAMKQKAQDPDYRQKISKAQKGKSLSMKQEKKCLNRDLETSTLCLAKHILPKHVKKYRKHIKEKNSHLNTKEKYLKTMDLEGKNSRLNTKENCRKHIKEKNSRLNTKENCRKHLNADTKEKRLLNLPNSKLNILHRRAIPKTIRGIQCHINLPTVPSSPKSWHLLVPIASLTLPPSR